MCKSISKVYNLGEGRIIAIDQSGIRGDKTALCFYKYDGEKTTVLKMELIEQSNDMDEFMDKFINKNMKEIYGIFGVSKELL